MTDTDLTEAHLERLVQEFYAKARADELLGPIFSTFVDDWDHHLKIVQNFWSHALLGTSRYSGSPFPVHMELPIKREHFLRWVELFSETAHETLPPDSAAFAIGRAHHMAQSFHMGVQPLEKPLRFPPVA